MSQRRRFCNFRLPSFNDLGIAFPHAGESGIGAGIRGTSTIAIDCPMNGIALGPDVLTPPEEIPHLEWKSLAVTQASDSEGAASGVPSSPVGSTSREQSATAVPGPERSIATSKTEILSTVEGGNSADTGTDTASLRKQSITVEGLDEQLCWLAPAIMAVASCISSTGAYSGSLRVLSHALPAPTMPGHVYSHIIDTVRAQCAPGQLQWINLMHAVPGRLNLADLPSSPPATPGPPIGGQDYFTTKVFNSAITTSEDQDPLTPRAASDRLLSPPGSVELVIVERYIPPSTLSEINHLFSIDKQSILVDRLVELTPGGGCLTLIYPTKSGCETFRASYLEPLLDPLLRSMISLHNLSADFGQTVSDTGIIKHMLEFLSLQSGILALCKTLSRSDADIRARLHGVSGKFDLVYAEQVEVELSGKIWSDWWARQEKVRLQKAISLYFVRGRKLPEDGKYQQAVLVEYMLQSLLKGALDVTCKKGVELGIFVIKRCI